VNRPIVARIQARASATGERKGGAEHRRRLLAGLDGRLVAVGTGSGVNFAHYPPTVAEVMAVVATVVLLADLDRISNFDRCNGPASSRTQGAVADRPAGHPGHP
jgi:hypothetical protein